MTWPQGASNHAIQKIPPKMLWLTISPNNLGFSKELIEEGDRLRDDVEFMTRLRQGGGVTNTGVAGTGQKHMESEMRRNLILLCLCRTQDLRYDCKFYMAQLWINTGNFRDAGID